MKTTKYVLVLYLIIMHLISCVKNEYDVYTKSDYNSELQNKVKTSLIRDIDGNEYETVLIEDKWVMKGFLKVTHFRNRDPIPESPNGRDVDDLKTKPYQWYNDNSRDAGNRYYTRAVIDDARGVCPDGYHVMSENDYHEIEDYCYKNGIESDISWKVRGRFSAHFYIWFSDSSKCMEDTDILFRANCVWGYAAIKCVKDTID